MDYITFLLLFNVSAIAMYLIDGVIAFFVPSYRVKKMMLSEYFVNKISNHWIPNFYESIRPKLIEDGKKILNDYKNELNSEIKILNQNINAEIQPLKDQVTNHLMELTSRIMMMEQEKLQNRSAKGVQAKSEKAQERLYMEQLLIEDGYDPTKLMLAQKAAKQFGGVAKYDMWLQWKCSKIMQKDGYHVEAAKEMSALQTGTRVQEIPQVQEEGTTEERDMGSVNTTPIDPQSPSEKLLEKQAKDVLKNADIPKDIIDQTFKQRKVNLKKKQKEKGVENGKEKKTKRKR